MYFSGLAGYTRLKEADYRDSKFMMNICDSLTKAFKPITKEAGLRKEQTFVTFYKVNHDNMPNEESLLKRLAAKLIYLSYSSITGSANRDYEYAERPSTIDAVMELRQTLNIHDREEARAITNLKFSRNQIQAQPKRPRNPKRDKANDAQQAVVVVKQHENMSFNVPEYIDLALTTTTDKHMLLVSLVPNTYRTALLSRRRCLSSTRLRL